MSPLTGVTLLRLTRKGVSNCKQPCFTGVTGNPLIVRKSAPTYWKIFTVSSLRQWFKRTSEMRPRAVSPAPLGGDGKKPPFCGESAGGKRHAAVTTSRELRCSFDAEPRRRSASISRIFNANRDLVNVCEALAPNMQKRCSTCG